MTKLSIRTGDKVRVLAGKDKGKEAKVLAVYPHNERVVLRARQHDEEGHAPDPEEP
jgi:large subunit ribosomal protein L24